MYGVNHGKRSQKFSENKHTRAHNSKNSPQKPLKGAVLIRKMFILRSKLFRSKCDGNTPYISAIIYAYI